MSCKGCSKRQDHKLNVYDWLCDVQEAENATDFVEVQFKNTRKGYFQNTNKISLEKGDIVAVESSTGHDIGTVSLTGKLVLSQIQKNNARLDNPPKQIYRKAKPSDIEKYREAKAREHDTMIRSRQIAANLGLNMKIGDVEYQGDGNKAIFYYIADERVDFRQLIKVLAETFHIRVEMKQIGARQEAGRIGGIGPCGRELCCSTWMSNFNSVSTVAARLQDISLNPQKLAGQCAKLKCCINFEVDSYVEALKYLPSKELILETKDSTYYHFKTDVFKKEITYSSDKSIAANLVTIPASRVFEVINLNKKGIKPISLESDEKQQSNKRDAQDILGQESVTRFDSESSIKKKKKKKKKNNDANNSPANKVKENSKETTNNTSKNFNKINSVSTDKPNKDNSRNNNNNRRNKNGNRENQDGNQENNTKKREDKSNNNRPKPQPEANKGKRPTDNNNEKSATNSNGNKSNRLDQKTSQTAEEPHPAKPKQPAQSAGKSPEA